MIEEKIENCSHVALLNTIEYIYRMNELKPVIIEDCSELKDYTESTTEDGIMIKLKGKVISPADTGPAGGGTQGGQPSSNYSCVDGICQEDSKGVYATLDLCIDGCTPLSNPSDPRNPDDDVIPDDRGGGKPLSGDEGRGERGICPPGQYWCPDRGCIPLKEACTKK